MSSPRLETKRTNSPSRCLSDNREGRSRSRSYSSSRSTSSSSPHSSWSSQSRSRSPSLEKNMTDAEFERMDKKHQTAFVQRKEASTLLMQKHHAERLEIIARKNLELAELEKGALNARLDQENLRLTREHKILQEMKYPAPSLKRQRSLSPIGRRHSRSRSPPMIRRRSRSPPKQPQQYGRAMDSYRPAHINPNFYPVTTVAPVRERKTRRKRGGRAVREREARRFDAQQQQRQHHHHHRRESPHRRSSSSSFTRRELSPPRQKLVIPLAPVVNKKRDKRRDEDHFRSSSKSSKVVEEQEVAKSTVDEKQKKSYIDGETSYSTD